MTLVLVEYPSNGNNYVHGGTLVIDPSPNNIQKSAKIKYIQAFSGLYALYPKAKYRWQRTVEYTLTGGCTVEKMREIEFYAMRNSKFWMDQTSGWGRVSNAAYYSDRENNPSETPWSCNSGMEANQMLMFTDCSYTYEEGKDWCTYTLKLQQMGTDLVLGLPPP